MYSIRTCHKKIKQQAPLDRTLKKKKRFYWISTDEKNMTQTNSSTKHTGHTNIGQTKVQNTKMHRWALLASHWWLNKTKQKNMKYKLMQSAHKNKSPKMHKNKHDLASNEKTLTKIILRQELWKQEVSTVFTQHTSVHMLTKNIIKNSVVRWHFFASQPVQKFFFSSFYM